MYNYNDAILILTNRFLEIKEIYELNKDDYENLPYVFYESVFVKYIVENANSDNKVVLNDIFNFIENMLINGDDKTKNLLEVAVIESLYFEKSILDKNSICIVIQEDKIKQTLDSLSVKPKLFITDSQAFKSVSQQVPSDIMLTSFSILMSRYKGFLHTAVKGVRSIESLKDNDVVLIAEGCTHHVQCDDIGTVKIPKWLKQYTNKDIIIETTSGFDYPEDVSKYALIIHCGGCMLNEREVKYRMQCAIDAGVPFTNYGITIAYMNGILDRSVEVFSDL